MCELHDQIKAGKSSGIVDSFVSRAVVIALTDNAGQKVARLEAAVAAEKLAAARKAAAAKAEAQRLAKHKVLAEASVGKTIQVRWSTGRYVR